tara:strand:- start:429 stop:533 length:105 start_codon:yes stop_codon:yes gene_type:complete
MPNEKINGGGSGSNSNNAATDDHPKDKKSGLSGS